MKKKNVTFKYKNKRYWINVFQLQYFQQLARWNHIASSEACQLNFAILQLAVFQTAHVVSCLRKMISGKDGDAIPWIMVLFATSLIIFFKHKIVHVLITMNFCKQKKVLSQESKGEVVVHAMNSHGGSR